MTAVRIGMCFDRTFPASTVTEFARRLDTGGADQLWLIEDCFYTSGPSLAAAALSVTERLQVGLGILPAVARNPAVTAMEIATLAGLGPGRVLTGIGHGVQDWMEQMGARPASPVTALADPGTPAHVRDAVASAGRTGEDPDRFHVAVFSTLCIEADRRSAFGSMAPWLAGMLASPNPGLRAMTCFDDLDDWFGRHGVDGLVDMPAAWWHEIGPIGTMDDAVAHLHALVDAGAHSIACFPAPDLDIARSQVDDVLALAGQLR